MRQGMGTCSSAETTGIQAVAENRFRRKMWAIPLAGKTVAKHASWLPEDEEAPVLAFVRHDVLATPRDSGLGTEWPPCASAAATAVPPASQSNRQTSATGDAAPKTAVDCNDAPLCPVQRVLPVSLLVPCR